MCPARTNLPGPPRPAALPRTARLDPPVVCPGFGFGKCLLMPPGKRSRRCSSIVWRVRGTVFSGRTDPSASRSARPRSAPPPRRAPPRHDLPVVCPGFGLTYLYFRKWNCVSFDDYATAFSTFNLLGAIALGVSAKLYSTGGTSIRPKTTRALSGKALFWIIENCNLGRIAGIQKA